MPERLEEAARVLRERAVGAAPGPWRHGLQPFEIKDDCGHLVAETWEPGDAPFIAMMHPGVALAFADVLDVIAYVKKYEQESDYFGIGDKADQALHAADEILRSVP